MITLTMDANDAMFYIAKRLGALQAQTPAVMKRAINATAKEARTMLANKAKETYAVKSPNFKKAIDTKKATASKLEATLKASGAAQNIADFKVSPANPTPKTSKSVDVLRGKVLKASGLKPLIQSGIKGFGTTMSSGHKMIARRLGPGRLPIKPLFSPSVPHMLGSEQRVYGVVEPAIGALLSKNIELEITKLLGARA